MNGTEIEVPICGQHYIETLKRSPASWLAMTDGPLVQSLRSEGAKRTTPPLLTSNPS
jgi:hypothetical protein